MEELRPFPPEILIHILSYLDLWLLLRCELASTFPSSLADLVEQSLGLSGFP